MSLAISATSLRLAREGLRVRLADLNAEIRGYPQPIARCDSQLGGLVDERDRVRHAIEEFDALLAGATQ